MLACPEPARAGWYEGLIGAAIPITLCRHQQKPPETVNPCNTGIHAPRRRDLGLTSRAPRRVGIARCWSDTVPVADGVQVPRALRAVLAGSPVPQHQLRARGAGRRIRHRERVGGGLVRRAHGDSALTPEQLQPAGENPSGGSDQEDSELRPEEAAACVAGGLGQPGAARVTG